VVVESAFVAADEKLASNPVLLRVTELIDAYDALFLASGRNDRQVRAIAEEIVRRVAAECGLRPYH
jgi:ribosome-associated protein